MTQSISFEPSSSGYWFTFWPDGELRTFRDQEEARNFAKRQALHPVFKGVEATDWDVARTDEQPEPGRIEYRFLGVTGEEAA